MDNTALVTGFMVAATAFITVAGIILAIGGKERLRMMSSVSLLVSLAFGTALIVKALGRFDNPSDSMQTLWILLTLQIITFYIPMWNLISYHYSKSGGENMLSEKEEKEINTKMDSLADEYMKKYILNTVVRYFDSHPMGREELKSDFENSIGGDKILEIISFCEQFSQDNDISERELLPIMKMMAK